MGVAPESQDERARWALIGLQLVVALLITAVSAVVWARVFLELLWHQSFTVASIAASCAALMVFLVLGYMGKRFIGTKHKW